MAGLIESEFIITNNQSACVSLTCGMCFAIHNCRYRSSSVLNKIPQWNAIHFYQQQKNVFKILYSGMFIFYPLASIKFSCVLNIVRKEFIKREEKRPQTKHKSFQKAKRFLIYWSCHTELDGSELKDERKNKTKKMPLWRTGTNHRCIVQTESIAVY